MKLDQPITLDDISSLGPDTQTRLMDLLEQYKRGERMEAINKFYNLFGLPKSSKTLSSVTVKIQELVKLFEA